MIKLNIFDYIAIIFVIIGGLNWGTVGLFNLDLVKVIFGDMTILSRIVYIIVALSAIYLVAITPVLGKRE